MILAARCDAYGESVSGEIGQKLYDEVSSKILKWQEPPPTKLHRALPVPLPPPRKKRGGRRYRKEKERYQLSELQKQKNRMMFGKQEVTDDYTGEGYGMIGAEGTGVLTIKQQDTQKLGKRLSQGMQQRLKKAKTATTTTIAGTASSIAFTPGKLRDLTLYVWYFLFVD